MENPKIRRGLTLPRAEEVTPPVLED